MAVSEREKGLARALGAPGIPRAAVAAAGEVEEDRVWLWRSGRQKGE